MIIDDEPIIRKGLKNILNWSQFECTICGEASDGEEGKNLIRSLHPDIIITDIRMPETDGLTMIREHQNRKCRIAKSLSSPASVTSTMYRKPSSWGFLILY